MRRRVLIVVIGLGLLLGVVGVGAWIATTRPPEWWAPPGADDGQAMAVAENLERRLSQEISRVREGDAPWAVRLDEPQINAWLALRMPKWIAHAGAPVDVEAQVHLVDGAIEIGVRRAGSGGEPDGDGSAGPIGVLRLRPHVADGAISAQVESAGLGSLALPGGAAELAIGAAESLLRAFAEESGSDDPEGDAGRASALAAVLRGERVPARWTLGDGRVVELLAIEPGRGELIVQCATRRD